MLERISVWVAGNIVPLTSIAIGVASLVLTFSFLKERRQLITLRQVHCEPKNFAQACISYILMKKIVIQSEKKWFRWFFFSSGYVRLQSHVQERALTELSKLDRFSSYAIWTDTGYLEHRSFLSQWVIIHAALFNPPKDASKRQFINVNSDILPDEYVRRYRPFGSIDAAIRCKMFQLYEKEALRILRSAGGYLPFSRFLAKYFDASNIYPAWCPYYSIKQDGNICLIVEHQIEIGERLSAEIKKLKEGSSPEATELFESYVLFFDASQFLKKKKEEIQNIMCSYESHPVT